MTQAPGEDEGPARSPGETQETSEAQTNDEAPEKDAKLSESELEDAFFGEAQEPPLKLPEATPPKVKPMRSDPTPSEEFFGESLAKFVEEVDSED